METEHYPHKIAAIYPDAASAEAAHRALQNAGLGEAVVIHLLPGSREVEQAIEPEQAGTRDHLIKDMLEGSGIGTVIGAAGAGVIAVALPSLFVSVPVVGPLMVAGYGAAIGLTAGAAKGLKVKEGLLAGVVEDAINGGFHALIVHSTDDDTHARAEAVIETTLAQDVSRV